MSGRIGDHHVPATQTPIVAPAETRTSGAGSSSARGSGRAERTTGVLGALSQMPAPSAQRRSGRTRPTVTSAQPSPIDVAAIEADEKAVKAALNEGNNWQELTHRAKTTVPQRLWLAEKGMKSAKSGLNALERLKGKITPEQYDAIKGGEIKGALMVRLVQSADYGLSAKSDQIQQWRWTGAGLSGASLPVREELEAMDKALAELQAFRAEIMQYAPILDDFVRECGQAGAHSNMLPHFSAVKSSVTRTKIALLSVAEREILVNVDRLVMLSMRSISPDASQLMLRVMQFAQAIRSRRDDTKQAMQTLESGVALSPEVRVEYKARVMAFGEQIHTMADDFCRDAACMPDTEANAPLWHFSKEMASTLSKYQAELHQAYDLDSQNIEPEAPPETPPDQAEESLAEASPPAQAEAETAPAKADKAAPGKAKKKRGKKPAKHTCGTSAAAQASTPKTPAQPVDATPSAPWPTATQQATPSPSKPVDGAQGMVDRALKKCPLELDTAMRASGDVAAIARAMGQNAREIEAMWGAKCDPIDAAVATRSRARHWFGDITRLRAASTTAQQSKTVEPASITELNNRLRALELVERNIDTRQADALKGHRYPRGKYISRLLKTNQIQEVGTPVRLRSDKEALYEIRIQPKPLSTGASVPPIFLHLHSNKPIPVEDLLKQPLRAFTAAHVKTKEQKNLGANYERYAQITDELHRFQKIHRGDVSGDLFQDLRDWMAARH